MFPLCSFILDDYLLGTWVPYSIASNKTAPEVDGFSAGNYDLDNTTMYVGAAENGGCGGQTTSTGRLTTKGATGVVGLYLPCSLGEQYKSSGITYLLHHPNLVIMLNTS